MRCGSVVEKRGQQSQALGRSRGGFSTKIHVSVDGLGNPLRFTLTAGQNHDIAQAVQLIDGIDSEYVIADRGYDSDQFRESIANMGMRSSIVRPSCPTCGSGIRCDEPAGQGPRHYGR